MTKHSGSMAENGAVTWNFEQKGLIAIPKEACDEEEMFEKAVEPAPMTWTRTPSIMVP